jgi:hypothetical protein
MFIQPNLVSDLVSGFQVILSGIPRGRHLHRALQPLVTTKLHNVHDKQRGYLPLPIQIEVLQRPP